MHYLTKCARDDGLNGVINCGSDRVLRALKRATLKNDIEIFSGVHLVR